MFKKGIIVKMERTKFEQVRELQIATTIKQGANGEPLNLKPGDHVVELTPPGVFRLTNDLKNQVFTLPQEHMDLLVDTERTAYPVFEDTTR